MDRMYEIDFALILPKIPTALVMPLKRRAPFNIGNITTMHLKRQALHFVIALLLFVLCVPLQAAAQTARPAEQAPEPNSPICPLIESVARANNLPVAFFARVIWQESRFQPDIVGPMTRSGERAQGIAQFMPGTAWERGVYEPFNPIEALPKSGEFLAELRVQFGNLGLAAAAYNAGPQRVRDFIAGLRSAPMETRNYVLSVTGRPIEDWARGIEDAPKEEQGEVLGTISLHCRDIVAQLKQTTGRSFSESLRKVPSWCRHLHHPDQSVCGSVHEIEQTTTTMSRIRLRGRIAALRAAR